MSDLYPYCRVLILSVFSLIFTATASAEAVKVTRLNDGNPIITRQMFEQAGAPSADGMNINGPSLIKVPDWLKKTGKLAHPDANYYLYFAHHQGKYIRLAWAKHIEGPWHLHAVNKAEGRRGVLDLGKKSKIDLVQGLTIHKHVASPDVMVDDKSHRIVMYFHAPSHVSGRVKNEQKTFVAVSRDGLDFNQVSNALQPYGIRPVTLGTAYFRVFTWHGNTYAIGNRGMLYRAPDPLAIEGLMPDGKTIGLGKTMGLTEDLWEKRQQLLLPELNVEDKTAKKMRHAAVIVREKEVLVFYTRIGDSPERILLSRISLEPDWLKWKQKQAPVEVLAPQLQWEGTGYQLRSSDSGKGTQEQALRDPYVYEEAGRYYLLYSGAGEEAIGLARLYLQK